MLIPIRDQLRAETAPLFTILIIGLNTVIFFFSFSGGALETLVMRFGFTPERALSRPEVLITSTFLHAGLLHLVSNMWFLWLYGDNVEDRFGRIPYLGLYVISGVAGNFTHAFFTGFGTSLPVIGASGAVAGVMGAYLVCFPRASVRSVFFLVFYPIFFNLPAALLLGVWMAGEFLAAMIAQPGDYVAHWAHIGGFLTGIFWGWERRHHWYRPRGWWW